MTGFLHVNVPHSDFTLESGADWLTSYRFGSGAAEHLFCSVWGDGMAQSRDRTS